MTKKSKLTSYLKKLVKEVLMENNQQQIQDLEKLLANPDPTRAKDYGSVDKYKAMLKAKIARLKTVKNEQTGHQPKLLVLISTVSPGTLVAVWKEEDMQKYPERGSDAHFKTETPFDYLMKTLDNPNGTASEIKVKNILRHLSPSERETLKKEKKIVTHSIPRNVVGL